MRQDSASSIAVFSGKGRIYWGNETDTRIGADGDGKDLGKRKKKGLKVLHQINQISILSSSLSSMLLSLNSTTEADIKQVVGLTLIQDSGKRISLDVVDVLSQHLQARGRHIWSELPLQLSDIGISVSRYRPANFTFLLPPPINLMQSRNVPNNNLHNLFWLNFISLGI